MPANNVDLTLYCVTGLPPNGWKVVIILEELGVNYRAIHLDISKGEQRSPAHLKNNPNGRLPTLVDHRNNDFVVWESAAIITYLVDKYDPTRKLSFDTFEEQISQLQWMFFHSSGQGPYFGQAVYFMIYSEEKIPSAIERYQREIVRILGVLESVLSKRDWLVGDKCSVADLSFVTWNRLAVTRLVKDFEGFDFETGFPHVFRWHQEMVARPAVQKVFAEWKATITY